jgi:lipopolysaccharide transport system permease protein
LLGILWIILQPLISTVLFTIIFGNLSKIPSDNIPYPIFVYTGLMFWNFYSSAVISSSNSLISNENIIKKVYFPRILSPVSSTLAHIVDLVPTLVIFIVMLLYYRVVPSLQMLILLPCLFVLLLISALGIGMFLAPLNARFRDVRYILPYFIQLGFFVTPVIYPTSILGASSNALKVFNPVAEAIEVSRSAFFGLRPLDWPILLLCVVFSLITFLVGFYYFRREEDSFIDIL